MRPHHEQDVRLRVHEVALARGQFVGALLFEGTCQTSRRASMSRVAMK